MPVFFREDDFSKRNILETWHIQRFTQLFDQKYSMHAVYNERTVNVDFMTLISENTTIYEKLFTELEKLNLNLSAEEY